MKKYETLRVDILAHLVITNLGVKYLMQSQGKQELTDKSNISGFEDNISLDKKVATLPNKAKLRSILDRMVTCFIPSYF